MLKLYADESWDDASSLMNVSGFLMTEDQFSHLDEMVRTARGDLPYFHMKEGHHLKHPLIYRELVHLIDPTSVLSGFSASIFKKDYRAITKQKVGGQSIAYWIGTDYTFTLGGLMALSSKWIGTTKYKDESVAYVFEAGHANEGDANGFWSQLSNPHLEYAKKYYRYASHTFVDGKGPLGSVLQLCDILAWNITKFLRDKLSTPEFRHLCKANIRHQHYGPTEIRKAIQMQNERWKAFDSKGRPRSSKRNL